MTTQNRSPIPTVAIVGHKNSGKTGLVVRLIESFTQAGLRVASVKHTSDEVGFDKPRSDSDRQKQAGAIAVGLVAKSEVGFYLAHTPQTSEQWIESTFSALPEPPDLIIYEGYRGGPHPKIECILKPEVTRASFTPEEGLLAVVSDHPIETAVPVLAYDPIELIGAVIRASFSRHDWPGASPKLH